MAANESQRLGEGGGDWSETGGDGGDATVRGS
jgi:hypothetical protein